MKVFTFICTALSAFSCLAAPSFYSVTEIGTLPGGDISQGLDLNNSGTVAGYGSNADGFENAVVYNGALAPLDPLPGGRFSQAWGINSSGAIVGSSESWNGYQRAVIFDPSGAIDLGAFGPDEDSFARSINDAGQITGFGTIGGSSHAFFYNGTSLQDLGTLGGSFSRGFDINNSGVIAGTSENASLFNRAFISQSGGALVDLGTLTGGNFSEAVSINDAGVVAGWADDEFGFIQAVTFQGPGNATPLGILPGGNFSKATGINNLGQVVGLSGILTGQSSFLWDPNFGLVDLATLVQGSRFEEFYAYGINDL
ncbi:MAG: hypothetical protein SFY81_13100, partial [Verrucomicrobiota bacterium]|nr:hypothetical protein [Verrucomicrobiota bacterium]